MAKKYVYFFGAGKADGKAAMKNLLGGKGANLAEMAGHPKLKLPVPPGFTITTDVCTEYYENNQKYPKDLKKQVEAAMAKVEKIMGKKFGDPKDPLLMSIRSGARASMPGMMETILNLGLNDATVAALERETKNPHFAWDSYRRFVQMYGAVVHDIPKERFEAILDERKRSHGAARDIDLPAEALREIVAEFKRLVRDHTGREFPDDPIDQMWGAIAAVFESWNNHRARV